MQMTNSEIRMRYRDGAPIQVLAELNACRHEVIDEIVADMKRKKAEPEPKKTVRPRISEEAITARRIEIEKLARAGMSRNEIARQLHCAPSVVVDHCNRAGIKATHTKADGGKRTREKMRKEQPHARPVGEIKTREAKEVKTVECGGCIF